MTHFVHNYHHLLKTYYIKQKQKQKEAYQQNLKESKKTDSVGVLQVIFLKIFPFFGMTK